MSFIRLFFAFQVPRPSSLHALVRELGTFGWTMLVAEELRGDLQIAQLILLGRTTAITLRMPVSDASLLSLGLHPVSFVE